MSKTESDSNVTMRDMEIFNEIRNYIRQRINNTNGNYYDVCPQKEEICEFVRRAVEFRESNSLIVCGPPGCGKTALVENVIKELTAENVINEERAFVIQLNGLLHTDDRLALKDITRQLKLAEGLDSAPYASFQENLIHMLEKLNKRKKEDTLQPCIIFILEEFHLFCGHKKQLLLYNLFDIAQAAKACVCIIGMTFYTDILDLLEKRVLSRFSHRIIWLNQCTSIEERLKMFKNIFILTPEDLTNVDEIYKVLWNMRINELTENKQVVEHLKRQLEIDPSQTKFRNLIFKLFNTVTFEFPLLTADNVTSVFTIPDYYISTLSSLSVLEMALVLAIKYQSNNYERQPFNFEMIYSHYLKFCKKNSTALVCERSVAFKGFQRLQELEIIIPVKKNVRNLVEKVSQEYQLYKFNLTDEQVADGVKMNTDLTTDLRQWAASAIS